MQITTGLTFDRVNISVTINAAIRTGDGISDQRDSSCQCVDGTDICDIRPKGNGSVGENVSKKLAIGTKCDAATNLPEDASGRGTVSHQYFSVGTGRDRADHLKYVEAPPIECQNP